ncbi:acetate/propionate family kinase [Pseudonocardia abyssalis]|nr:acetate/propionate family kinase [Pseudonocardia abyssalis]
MKLRLLGAADTVERSADLAGGVDPAQVTDALRGWPVPDAVGHRVVHGGTSFTVPVRIDAAVRARLAELTDLAPLHQPPALAALDAVTALLPDVPAVACLDTAFHATLPSAAATYPVPREWRERLGVRRYGFHGLSHAYCAGRVAELLGGPVRRIVTCHLGAGASLAAVLDGRSVDTTMGFTPLDGLVMATRSGSVDPGLVLWLCARLPPDEVAAALEYRSGLTALAGSGDLRIVEAAAARGDPDALLALDVHTHHLVAGIAAMAAALGGLDALAFTGGVGEHSAGVRGRAARGLAFLGVDVDGPLNRSARGDVDVSTPNARVRTLVVTAREDLEIARGTRRVLAG